MKYTTYEVKAVEGATLGWGIYQVARDAPDVRNLVALAIDQTLAQRIARMLSGDDLDDQAEHEANDAQLWAWRMGT